MAEWQVMVSEEAYFLREATGTSAVAETARTVALALATSWDALQAEK